MDALAKRPAWDEYFINIALAVSLRATCKRRIYGALIVKDHIIISTGYNGAARGEVNCLELPICPRKEMGIPSGERYELCKSVHAEANAIISGDPKLMKGATIYIAGYEVDTGEAAQSAQRRYAQSAPCLMCMRMIQNAGIATIVHLTAENSIEKIYV